MAADAGIARVARSRLGMVVDDLSLQTEAELRRPVLTPLGTLTLLCLRFLRGASADQAVSFFERSADLLRAVDRDEPPPAGADAIGAVGRYALQVVEIPHLTLHAAFERLLQRPEETIMSTAEKLRREGREQGHAEGLAEGLAEGRTAVLLRQLSRRFGTPPAHIAERLAAATITELDRWADRVLDAGSLDEVFASD